GERPASAGWCFDKPAPAGRRRPFAAAMGSALGELEALASPLAAILLALFHAAVAGQVTAVAQFLGHAARAGLLLAVRRRVALLGWWGKHVFQGAGDTLADRPGLAGEAAPRDVDQYVQPAAHLRQLQRTEDGAAVFILGEVGFQRPVVDADLAV